MKWLFSDIGEQASQNSDPYKKENKVTTITLVTWKHIPDHKEAKWSQAEHMVTLSWGDK